MVEGVTVMEWQGRFVQERKLHEGRNRLSLPVGASRLDNYHLESWVGDE